MENRKTPKVKYATARANLLMVVLLTLANALLLAANSDYNFPFSAFIPQVLVVLGLNNTPDMQEFKLGFSILFVFLAFLILLFFFLAYLFSKKETRADGGGAHRFRGGFAAFGYFHRLHL